MADSPKRLTPTQQRGQDILMEGHDSNHRKHNGPKYRAEHERIWGKKCLKCRRPFEQGRGEFCLKCSEEQKEEKGEK